MDKELKKISSNLQPLANRVLIIELENEEKVESVSGIIIPDEVKEANKTDVRRGFVAEVGKDVEEIKFGMTVFYNHYNADPIEEDDHQFVLVDEDSILVYLKE